MAHDEALPPGHFHHLEPEQAYHSSKLAMWIFLATEIHLFGGAFCVFAFFRWRYFEEFNHFAQQLNWQLGATNTAVLLASSYTMVRAVDAAQKGLNDKCGVWLNWTILGGLLFFVIKGIEYSSKFSHGIYPNSHIFWGLYYTMTGIHAFHVAVGIGVLIWLRILAARNRFSTVYYTPVEVVGLYWHIVDVIWIFLFPIMYLLGGIGSAAH